MPHNKFTDIIKGYEDNDLRQGLPPGCMTGYVPLVSVCVTTYNHGRYIRDCLDGILMQKVDFKYEIIICDDCSTDDTQQIILQYADIYPEIIRPILGKTNIYSKGRNREIEQFLPLSRGKYITACEGDDYWVYSGRMQAMVDFLESHSGHSMVFHAYQGLSEIKGLGENFPRLRRGRNVGVHEVLIEPHMQFAAFMGRLDILKQDKEIMSIYTRGEHVFLDIIYYLSFLNSGKIYGMPHLWSVYRVHQGGVYTQLQLNGMAQAHDIRTLDVLETLYDGKYKGLKQRREAFLKFQSLLNLWTYERCKGNVLNAFSILLRAFISHPGLFLKTYYHRYVR